MNIPTTIAHTLLRLTGLIQIVLGLLFWTDNGLNLIPVHIWSGLFLVLSLWILAALAGIAGVDRRFVALAFVWGGFVVWLGLNQSRLLPGSMHWIVEVVHLLVGLGAIGQGEGLAARIREQQAPALPV